MELREFVRLVGEKYDRTLPMSSEAQQLLRQAGKEVIKWIPGTYIAEGSGGKGVGATCPWIAIFNPEETETARRGMYVVYLYAADMKSVALSLNQGVTEIGETLGRPKARQALRAQAAAIRDAFAPEAIRDLDDHIDLRTKAPLPVDYEYGNIVARTYQLDQLPDQAEMVADLHRFIQLYDLSLEAREEGAQQGHSAIVTPRRRQQKKKKPLIFKPKDDSEYRQLIRVREALKKRTHETLVNSYAYFLEQRGFFIASPHPRDLTADRGGLHYLVEAKIIRGGDAEGAAREAFAQLFFYGHFLYDRSAIVSKVALFNEKLGDAHLEFFEQMGIAVVWADGEHWGGTPTAIASHLC
ncbi:MrcB family domain-containing protein [Nonomuraea sp. H19]|uniref:MrcB family domain-containing protein n=1 Tax=Nonomuraea sp. H19 TaxID=3452206 RepID=UPI003F88F590